MPKSLAETDWSSWRPTDVATLVFVIRGGEILLIEKKRGLGAGKVNGPGGRLEPGETALEAAVREVREELLVTPTGLAEAGHLSFQFTDGYGLACHVFSAAGCEGVPRETDEAVPLWTPLDAIPFGRMWADDRLWLPLLIGRRPFRGRFVFDGEAMLDHEVVELPPDEA